MATHIGAATLAQKQEVVSMISSSFQEAPLPVPTKSLESPYSLTASLRLLHSLSFPIPVLHTCCITPVLNNYI
jgi:hypothetical protein